MDVSSKLSPENLCLILWSLEELSCESEQRRYWLSDGANGAEVSSFDEVCCQLYDDSRLGSLLENGVAVFGEPIDEMFRVLSARLVALENDACPVAIIADQRVHEIRTMAADILAAVTKQFN